MAPSRSDGGAENSESLNSLFVLEGGGKAGKEDEAMKIHVETGGRIRGGEQEKGEKEGGGRRRLVRMRSRKRVK